MEKQRLDVGFVPVECPGIDGTGATYTSSLLVEHLSKHHDLTVYVASQHRADPEALPARDRVDYVLSDGLSMLPHPIRQKQRALEGHLDALETHDLVHSYSSAFIPVLDRLDTPTLVTLNSYLPVCPKADFRYRGKSKCDGPGAVKCAGCIASTAARRRRGVVSELKATYLAAGKGPLVRHSLQCSDAITAFHALSPHLREDYADLGFPRDDVTVVPHFYDEQFRPDGAYQVDGGATNEAYQVDGGVTDEPGQSPTLLYVGALQDIKGVDVLLRALPLLRERGRDVELQIAGTGPEESSLRSLADGLSVDEHVTWLGYVDHDELPELYRKCDVFVYPGVIDEPFGRVVLEALASGTPIVGSDVGSIDYIVGSAGALFDAGDERGLADGVERVLNEYPSYRRAVPDQLEQFAPETVLEEFLALYRKTVGRK